MFFSVTGKLENEKILEASGLARSQREAGVLWVHNDNGNKPRAFSLDLNGRHRGQWRLADEKNRDWEDLASFSLGGEPYLMIAEVGDNDARYEFRSLYFVHEPSADIDDTLTAAWKVEYVYPDGARDAESAAVDLPNNRALILSKRDLPPRLYAVPLRADARVTAELLGDVTSLRPPTRQDIALAPKLKDWWWQPVGMDISADNTAAVVLTYREVYVYRRDADQSWLQALNGEPIVISLGNFQNAEAVAFADNEFTVVVTGENRNSRILSVDLSGVMQP